MIRCRSAAEARDVSTMRDVRLLKELLSVANETVLILKVKLVPKSRGVKIDVLIEVFILIFNNDLLEDLMAASIACSSLFRYHFLSLLLNWGWI